ncbi:MAG: hypothetical protein LQ344_001899 [Seirophora lacunosa]|nr:MAG: hypothetical protein LQ344_001899 [Seirophora lacunosa]
MPSVTEKDADGLSSAAGDRPPPDQVQSAPAPPTSLPATLSAPGPPYTLFSRSHRRLITLILILTMLASPLTATIYLPLLPLLATHFRTTPQAINLTLTLYIVFQALSPLIFAPVSDALGRRPVFVVTFAIYTLASLGLALNRSSYAALLALRALQSLGASAVLAIAYGVVADLCVPSERGAMQGPAMGAANLAVCVGPVVGGWVALASGGYEWVFWSLVIYGGLVLGVVGMGLPETARNVVGNGEMEARWWGRTWWSLLVVWRMDRRKLGGGGDAEGGGKDEKKSGDEATQSVRRSFKMPNPFAAVRIIFWRDTALVLWMAGSPYAVWYCVQASIPPIYKDVYGFNDLQIGLAYLTGGFSVVLASYANGKFMDWNYRMTARQTGHTVDRISGDDLNHFPIERARARGSWHILGVYMCVLIGYGWAVQRRAHESIPLILQFILAAICTVFQQTFNILLVDIFPASPSTAAASGNITRCALSAVAVAILQPLVDRMGRGWYFTFLGLLSGGGGVAANWLIITRGMAWRHYRLGISHVAEKGTETKPNSGPQNA